MGRIADLGSEPRKFFAPEFIFGEGCLDLAGEYAVKLGAERPLLVTDPGVQAAGWADRVCGSLRQQGLEPILFSHVTVNPRASEVAAGAQLYLAKGCDAIVAVGGGSPIDCAKGIGIVVTAGQRIQEFEGVDSVSLPLPPLMCIPTTAGTGADVSQFAIIRDQERARKFAVVSKAIVPDLSLVDPETLTTLEPYHAACAAIDALSHAVEAYVSTGNSPFTDLYALEAIRLIARHWEGSIGREARPEDRRGLMLGALQAGLAFSNAGLGLAHSMAHALGSRLDNAHGACIAASLESVMSFNFPESPERCRGVAGAMECPVTGAPDDEVLPILNGALAALKRRAGLYLRLSQLGLSAADIPSLSQNTVHDLCIATNPRIPSIADLEGVYERIL